MSAKANWLESLAVYWQPGVRSMLFLGFSSGLPLLLVYGTLSFWLRKAGIERSTIGFLSWVALAYAFKWVWAPVVGHLRLPWLTRKLGRRRSWMLLAQAGVITGLCGLVFSDPRQGLASFALLALLVAFSSATQDIVIDAYRIERAEVRQQGAMAASYMIGYRVAMIASGGGVLALVGWLNPIEGAYVLGAWSIAYLCMALLMLVGVVTVLVIDEPKHRTDAQTRELESEMDQAIDGQQGLSRDLLRMLRWFWVAMICPFLDFIRRFRWQAVLLLALIATYRISDIVLGVISNVFYVDMGFTEGEVGLIVNTLGVFMTLLGAVVGGLLVARLGVMKVLLLGGVLAASTNLLFAWMAGVGHNVVMLILVITADNLSAGLASAAFVAYLSGLTNVAYSATQYALFSSVMLLLPKFIGGFSGVIVDNIGYVNFYLFTTSLGVPVLLLILLAMRYQPVAGGEDDR